MTDQPPIERRTSGGGASESTAPAAGTSAATDVSLREYMELTWRWQERFEIERDRRYTEIAEERREALKIKEAADAEALRLARELQREKDEQHNGLLKAWTDERGSYVTQLQHTDLERKIELALAPIVDFVAGQRGATSETQRLLLSANTRLQNLIALAVAIVVIVEFVLKFT